MKCIVIFMAPSAVIAEWMKKPEVERKQEEEKMMKEWNEWTEEHKGMILESVSVGKTKRVTKDGIADVTNDMMLYSIVEGESEDMIAEVFKNHPHFTIPKAYIEIMPLRKI